jgi:hypothetical protein
MRVMIFSKSLMGSIVVLVIGYGLSLLPLSTAFGVGMDDTNPPPATGNNPPGPPDLLDQNPVTGVEPLGPPGMDDTTPPPDTEAKPLGPPGTDDITPPEVICDPNSPLTRDLITVNCPENVTDTGTTPPEAACDPDASVTSELVCIEICDNGIDDNNDGLTDAEDPQCAVSENHEPIARASAPGIVSEGETVTLNGGQSDDPDGDEITYSWAQTGGPSVSLSESESASPSFAAVASQDAPCIDGLPTSVLTFQLTVFDGEVDSAPSSVEVKVMKNYDPLTVTTVSDAAVRSGEYALLSAAVTGGTGCGKISYDWKQTAGSAGVLSNPTSRSPGFKAPTPTAPEDVTLVVEATENDGIDFPVKSAASIKVCPPMPIVSLGNREVNIPEIGSGDCDYSRIDVRGTSAGPITGAHLFIIYTDKNGKETLFRGGPTVSNPVPFVGGGPIRVDWDPYEPSAIDWDLNSASVTILKGAAVHGKDGCLAQEASRINGLQITYYKTGPNSNTVVKTLLQNCNLRVTKPPSLTGFPGFGDPPL